MCISGPGRITKRSSRPKAESSSKRHIYLDFRSVIERFERILFQFFSGQI